MKKLFSWAFDKEKEQELDILKKANLFKGLSKKLLRKLIIDLIPKDYRSGESIFSEGDSGKALYIVMKGSVKIIRHTASGEKTLAKLGSGSYFGELALISNSQRFATAVADENTKVLIMYKAYFDDLIKGHSAISSQILLNLLESLSNYISSNQINEQSQMNTHT